MVTKALIIDGDGHVFEPDDLWTERMDAAALGRLDPAQDVEDEIYETIYVGGEVARRWSRAPRPDGGRGRHDARRSSSS